MAARARCRREANRERKKRLERRRLKEAEATRVKHEGPSLAEVVRANVGKMCGYWQLETRAREKGTALKQPLLNMNVVCFSLRHTALFHSQGGVVIGLGQAVRESDQHMQSATLPPDATQKASEQAVLLDKRQRFFLTVVAAVSSATRWRNDWKERKWKMARFAEALAGVSEEKARKTHAPNRRSTLHRLQFNRPCCWRRLDGSAAYPWTDEDMRLQRDDATMLSSKLLCKKFKTRDSKCQDACCPLDAGRYSAACTVK